MVKLDLCEQGVKFAESGMYDEAIKRFDKALEIDSEYKEAWNGKGTVLMKLNRWKEAIKYFEKSLKNYPKYVDALYKKGICLANLKP